MHRDAKPRLEFLLQVHPAPAHHLVHHRIGACLDEGRQSLFLRKSQRALVAAGAPFAQIRRRHIKPGNPHSS